MAPRPPGTGRAPPPQVADVEQKTTLFCSTRAGPGRMPASSASITASITADYLEGAAFVAQFLVLVGALQLQPLQVLRCHIAGDVLPREARRVELLDARILVLS